LPNRECPMYKCVPCPGGYEVDQDGCQTCTCKEEKRAVCSGVMCLMFCINGFATGPDGCPICSCA
ncbi:DEC-2, partial [Biomphalaria glabrata]